MTAPYDYEALWLKAKLFLNRAMDERDPRPFDEQALWASLALELLAKAALARVSPLLIADPRQDSTSLLAASGLIEANARFSTISTTLLYERCRHAYIPFNDKEATRISQARNEYLHGSTPGFTHLPPKDWWSRYWAQAVTLITALDREPYDLVGLDRAHIVDEHLEQNKKNVEHHTQMRIERAKRRLAQWKAGNLPAKVAAQWMPGPPLLHDLPYLSAAECPACGAEGIVQGEHIEKRTPQYVSGTDDVGARWEVEVFADVIVTSAVFHCGNCNLPLDDHAFVTQAGLPANFEAHAEEAESLFEQETHPTD